MVRRVGRLSTGGEVKGYLERKGSLLYMRKKVSHYYSLCNILIEIQQTDRGEEGKGGADSDGLKQTLRNLSRGDMLLVKRIIARSPMNPHQLWVKRKKIRAKQ